MKSTLLFISFCLMSASVYAQQQGQLQANHQGATQAISQGASQTGQVANHLKQEASSVAQAMKSTASSIKASDEAQDNARSGFVPLPPPPAVPEKIASPKEKEVCGSVGHRFENVGGCIDL